jgi:DNA helicase-2/ATP-dependent DNA helicase PcrA
VAAVDVTPDAETGEIVSPLAAFLTHAALEAGDNQAQAGQDAVQLMTVHSAKGLEFDCVFITGMEEGLFPHENSMSDVDGLEEERRLMYVAITRATRVPHVQPDAHAAWSDALSREEPLSRRIARWRTEM